MQVVTRSPYLSRFLFYGSSPVARRCVRGGVSVVSKPVVLPDVFTRKVAQPRRSRGTTSTKGDFAERRRTSHALRSEYRRRICCSARVVDPARSETQPLLFEKIRSDPQVHGTSAACGVCSGQPRLVLPVLGTAVRSRRASSCKIAQACRRIVPQDA